VSLSETAPKLRSWLMLSSLSNSIAACVKWRKMIWDRQLCVVWALVF